MAAPASSRVPAARCQFLRRRPSPWYPRSRRGGPARPVPPGGRAADRSGPILRRAPERPV